MTCCWAVKSPVADLPRGFFGHATGLCLLLVFSAGCLPYSCQRISSQALSPADSLSILIAQEITPDTLYTIGTEDQHPSTGKLPSIELATLEYPRTLLYNAEGELIASDAMRNSILFFDSSGTFLREVTWDSASTPYLAGVFSDTVAVFSPANRRIDYIVGDQTVHMMATPQDLPEHVLQYVVATRSGAFIKTTGEDLTASILGLDFNGQIRKLLPLGGNEWYNSGALRIWGDTLVSLTGFFPVVKVISPALDEPPDSVSLKGFVSPWLSRTFQFTQGDARGAPLLSSAAFPAGDFLLVLNLRLGWLHIDVYNREGQLLAMLVDPELINRNFYPVDLTTNERSEEIFDIAVAVIEPDPVILRYRWSASSL